jgi:lauroyl/myristoyl acyltransferase
MIKHLFNRLTPGNFSVRYQILFPLYSKLPIKIAYFFADLQSKLLSIRKKNERMAFFNNIKATFPEITDKQIHKHINRYFALVEREALDTWFIRHPNIQNTARLINRSILDDALTQNRPIILTTGHFGRYWLTGAALSAANLTTGALTRDDIADNFQRQSSPFDVKSYKP